MMEREAKEWLVKGKIRSENGVLNRMVAEELFDHTWIASVIQLERNLRIADGQKVLDAGCGWGRLVLGLNIFTLGFRSTDMRLPRNLCEKLMRFWRILASTKG